MRLLVLVNNYIGSNSTNSQSSVEKTLQGFSTYTQLDVDVVLFSTAPSGMVGGADVTELVYPVDLSYAFAFVPRQWLMENLCCLSHEYIMYTENDLIISESAVLNCIEATNYLRQFSYQFISGFIRFEHKEEKKYIDMLPCVRPTVEKLVQSKEGRKFWVPGNVHSGNFLISRSQLDLLIQHRRFQTTFAQYGKQYGGILESAASDIYMDFTKVLPEDFTSVEIEHISNKYEGLTYDALRQEVANPSGRITGSS